MAHQCHIDEKTCSQEVTLRTCGNPAGGLAPDFEVFHVPLPLGLSFFSIAQNQSWMDGLRET